MKQYTEKLIGIGALMLLIAVTITIIISYSQAERIKQTTGQLAGVNERLHLLEDLLLHTLDNTTNERGYALTGQEPYVAAIRQNTRAIQQNMKELQIVFSHGQSPPVLIDSLLFYLQAHIQFAEKLIQAKKREGPAAVVDLIRKGEEESFLPQIRRLIVLLENNAREEQKLLNARRQSNLLILNQLLVGSLIVIFLLMVVILFIVKKELDRRKKMQAELNRFNERLTEEVKQKTREQTEILERISDAFAVLDKNWNYIYLNKQAAAYIGKDPEELIGKNIWQENPEWMGMPFQKAYFRAMEEQKIIYHEEYNAEWDKWFELHIYPSPKGLSIFFRDITEQKKAEEKLKQSEEKYRSLTENLKELVYRANPETFVATFVNKAVEEFYGYTVEEWLSDPLLWEKTIYPEDKDRVFQVVSELKRMEKDSEIEYRIIHKDGTVRWVIDRFSWEKDSAGRLTTLNGVMSDITDRKKAEEKLKQSEEKYRTLFEQMDEGFCIIEMIYDSQGIPVDYRFLEINPVFMKQTGLTDALTKTMREMVPDHDSHWFRIYGEIVRTGEPLRFENPATAMGRYYDVFAFRMGGEGSRKVGVIFNDITERKKAEEEIKNTNEQLQQLTAYLQTVREEERRHISREIHDELGQQLTAVKMDLAWLDKKIPEKETALKAKLTNSISLLDESNLSIRKILSELRMGLQERQSLPEALEWLLQQFKAQSGVVVSFNSDVQIKNIEEPVAACIFRVCQEALTNITRYAEAKKVKASLIQKDNQLLFEIEDDGKGFDSDTVNKKGSFGILGMKERVNALNGNFKLVSAKGKGTKIVVSLPYKT